MDPDDDVLGKADALLRRHGLPPPATGSDTGGVPILTDMIEAPPIPGDIRTELAREVFERVIGAVEGKLATELERRLVDHLLPEIQAAVHGVIGDLRQELANTIGDAVSEAIERRKVK